MYYKYNNRPHTVHMPDKMNYDDADGGDDDDKKPNQLIVHEMMDWNHSLYQRYRWVSRWQLTWYSDILYCQWLVLQKQLD